MTWFRVHNDIMENPKLLMLAPSDRWFYISILSLKSQGVLEDFKGDKLDRVMCVKLRLTGAEWEECARRLQEEDLIDKNYQPTGWDARQYKSDSSTDRVRKHREKKKAKPAKSSETPPRNGSETLHVTDGETLHVTDGETFHVGYRNKNVSPPDTDTESETDTDKTSSEPKGSAAIAAKPANSRLTRLENYYDSPDQGEDSATSVLYALGVGMLGRYRIPEPRARGILGMYLRDYGEGPTMDAICEIVCRQPTGDPIAYMVSMLKTPRVQMPKDWAPTAATVETLTGMGISENVIDNARAFFKLWVLEREVASSDFDGWFQDWCTRDFEDAECDAGAMGRWYGNAKAQEFVEPPGSVPG